MFAVQDVKPEFYLDPAARQWAQNALPTARRRLGINPYSGGRWPSKELRPAQLRRLIGMVLDGSSALGADATVVLIGAGEDYARNQALVAEQSTHRVMAVCTDQSVQHLAAAVGALDYLVSSDSLALHLGIAQAVPFTAFFSPTSAVEIDEWGLGTKVISTAPDYCSYRKDADNSSITADRILMAMGANPRLAGDARN
jgi:heptosyltransferase-2